MPRKLSHLFGREADLIARCARSIRTVGRRIGARPFRKGRVVEQMRRRKREKARGLAETVHARRRAREALKVRRLPRGMTPAAIAVSVAFHIVLAVFLISKALLLTGPEQKPKPSKEIIISIRLPPKKDPNKPDDPKPPTPKPPTPEPEKTPRDEPKPEPPNPKKVTQVSPEKPTPRPPGEKTPEKAEPKIAKRDPLPTPKRIRPLRDPPPLGIGGSRPRFAPLRGVSSAGALSSRGEEGRFRALAAYGGNGRTENAVDRGLRWLAEHQDADGGWQSHGFQRHCRHYTACPGDGLKEFDVGVSSLAILAFLGAGHMPNSEGPYRRHVDKGLRYLLEHQNGSGSFAIPGDKYLYNHGLATLALAEALTMTRDEKRYKDSLEAAVRYTLSSMQPGDAWDYTSERTGRHDLSITGWQIMALRGAELAGVSIPPQMKKGIRHYIDRAFTSSGYGIYANIDPEAGRRGVNMVAVGLLSHLYMGGTPDDRRTRNAVKRIIPRHPPQPYSLRKWDTSFQSYYYWYAATLSLFHLGGEPWEAWNTLLQEALLPRQRSEPHINGSWDPEPSWIGLSGGRVYSTAINVLTLEVYYRYKPLFASRRS